MAFYALPYRVLFHDTMSYGSHHFLTNFKFQCTAREHLFFEEFVDESSEGRAAHESHILLTREGYTRNLAPVEVGQRVAILLSLEDQSLSSVRFCFRVVREDGEPVCCGYQTLVCISKETGRVVPAPPIVLKYGVLLREELENPTFADRIHAGKLREVFAPGIRQLGRNIACSETTRRVIDSTGALIDVDGFSIDVQHVQQQPAEAAGMPSQFSDMLSNPEGAVPGVAGGLVFIFPGQGSYVPGLLGSFCDLGGKFADLARDADEIATAMLAPGLMKLARTTSSQEHDQMVRQRPELAQLAMYLAGVMAGEYLLKAGVMPGLLVGHSVGELPALAIGGAYDPRDGVALVCHRLSALRQLGPGVGGMLAVLAPRDEVASLIQSVPHQTLDIAVVNAPGQTVISGRFPELEAIETAAAKASISTRRLRSPYPFHNPLLTGAVAPLADALRSIRFSEPRIPVYSPIEGRTHGGGPALGDAIASHFVPPLFICRCAAFAPSSGGRHLRRMWRGEYHHQADSAKPGTRCGEGIQSTD